MKNKEIEVKFLINKEIKNAILSDLRRNSVIFPRIRQIDTYYIPEFKDFEINGETMECVRIREVNGKNILAYKKIHRDASPIYCDEFETEIESKEQLQNILFALGFSVQMVIDKTRETYHYGNFEFDFDSVAGLGELLEVELKDENATLDKVFDFVSKYGLSPSDVTYEGIQVLMKKAMKKQ